MNNRDERAFRYRLELKLLFMPISWKFGNLFKVVHGYVTRYMRLCCEDDWASLLLIDISFFYISIYICVCATIDRKRFHQSYLWPICLLGWSLSDDLFEEEEVLSIYLFYIFKKHFSVISHRSIIKRPVHITIISWLSSLSNSFCYWNGSQVRIDLKDRRGFTTIGNTHTCNILWMKVSPIASGAGATIPRAHST